jgi:hypothetical protein
MYVSGRIFPISARTLSKLSAAQTHSRARMALIRPGLPSNSWASLRLIQTVMSSLDPRSGWHVLTVNSRPINLILSPTENLRLP